MPIAVSVLNKTRDDYRPKTWRKYHLLYKGGEEILAAASEFLIKNAAEHKNWYDERVKRFTYKNIIGPVIDDYGATVLQQPIKLDLKKDGEKRPDPGEFYTEELWPNPTGAGGKTLGDLAFDILTGAMAKGETWVRVGTPKGLPGYAYDNLADQEKAGALRVQWNKIDPSHVINAYSDQFGLSWVMLRYRLPATKPITALKPNEKPKERIQWTRISRKEISVWELEVEQGKNPKDDDLVNQVGETITHQLAEMGDRGTCPIQRFDLTSALWMMNRVSLVVVEELRKRNALSWYETLTCFPQLKHKGGNPIGGDAEEGQTAQVRGAAFCYELPDKDEDLEWLEPGGASLEHNAKRLEAMERDIYKGVVQMAAAQGPGAAAAIQSGASKVMDNLAKSIICEKLAEKIRAFVGQLAGMSSFIRGDLGFVWEVSGASRFNTQDQEGAVKTGIMAQTLAFMAHSETATRELAKRTALALLPDAPTEILDLIAKEIDAMEVKPPDDGDEELGNRIPPAKKKNQGDAK